MIAWLHGLMRYYGNDWNCHYQLLKNDNSYTMNLVRFAHNGNDGMFEYWNDGFGRLGAWLHGCMDAWTGGETACPATIIYLDTKDIQGIWDYLGPAHTCQGRGEVSSPVSC